MAHEHNVIDSDKHFKINPKTREITNESDKLILMQHDHNSERFTFEVPRYIESHDMSQCNRVQIHYKNIEVSSGTEFDDIYEVDDFQIGTDQNTATFSWLISGNATQYVGALNFSVRFACVADDGTIEYVWNTAVQQGIVISACFFNSEAVISAFSDVLEDRMRYYTETFEQWREEMYLASIGEGVSVSEVRSMLGAVAVVPKTVKLRADSWVNGAQTISVEGVTDDEATCHVFATYHPGSYAKYRDSYIRCSAQGNGTLTFECDSDVLPNRDVYINIALYYSE